MALFKIHKGTGTFPTKATEGYCYFNSETGRFAIDIADAATATTTQRKIINPDAFVGVSRSGVTWTFTTADGSTKTLTQQDNNTNYYHARVYSSGLKISTGTGVSDMYIPVGTTNSLGVVKQHNAANCTSYTSDEGATTPKAVQKAVNLFTADGDSVVGTIRVTDQNNSWTTRKIYGFSPDNTANWIVSRDASGGFNAGYVANGNKYIAFPDDGDATYNGAQTGYLCIALPTAAYKNACMCKFKVSIYNYVNNTSVDYIISGYTYNDGAWYQTTALCLGKKGEALSNLPVSFGYDTTRMYVYIGTSATAWSYPNITISDITVGHSGNIAQLKSGWGISFTTTTKTIQTTKSNTLISYNSYYADYATSDANGANISTTYAKLAGNNTFSGKNIFTASNGYNTLDTQKFLVGNSSSAFVFGGDGMQCFAGTSSTTAKVMYLQYYGGDLKIGTNGCVTIGSSGAISTSGNISGNYIQGTWLYTSAATALTSASKIAVIHTDNYIYYITPANLRKLINNIENKAYNAIATYYPAGTTPTYYRITFPDAQDAIWGMYNLEFLIRENYSSGTGGKVIVNAHHANAASSWATLTASVHGNLTTNIKVYASGTKYLYIGGCSSWSTIALTNFIVGDGATGVDLSGISIDYVTSLPSGYQTATMNYGLHSNNYTSYTVTKTGSGASGTWGINITGSSASCTGNSATASLTQVILNDSSNWRLGVSWRNTTLESGTYLAGIGRHNVGGDGTGSISIVPYATNSDPWSGTIGLYISKTDVKFEGNSILHAGNYTSYTVTKTGTGASGTWGISISGSSTSCTGNSATATQASRLTSNITFTPAETAITPANVKSLIGSGSQIRKGVWSYAGNGHIATGSTATSQCPFGVIDLAGTTVIQSTTGTEYTQIYITPPTASATGAIKGEMLYYIDQGSGYSPTWYRVLTNNNYTSYTVKKDGTGASGNWNITSRGLKAQTALTSSTVDAFLEEGVLKWATADNTAVGSNDGLVVSFGWSSAYGAQIWLDDGSGEGGMKIRNRGSGGSTWNPWRQVLTENNYTSYAAPSSHTHSYLPLSGGTMTGHVTMNSTNQIKSAHTGGSYWKARDLALIRHTAHTASSSYSPIYAMQGLSGDFACGLIHYASGESKIEWRYTTNTTYTAQSNDGSSLLMQLSSTGSLTASSVYGAVWNDYAEFRETKEKIEAGRVVIENGDDTLSLATERLMPGANIVSDTFGFAIGETDNAKTPLAVSGRALVYAYEDRNSYKAGDPVCSGPNGTVSKMTREEVMMYPDRMIGTVSSIPDYKTWGTGNVSINNRIWVKVV